MILYEQQHQIVVPEQVMLPAAQQSGFASSKHEVFVQTSSSSKVVSSSAAEPQVEVHSVTKQDEKTTKQINQNAPEVKESHFIKEFHQVGHEAPVVHEKFVTTASELPKSIASSGDQHQIVYQRPSRPLRPPKFTTPIIGKIVDQGVDVVLEGIVDGQPTPNVTWTKNGEELKPKLGTSISFANHRVVAEVKNVTTGDSGRYSCTAINEAGTAVSTADLVVRSKCAIFKLCLGKG